MYVRDLCLSAFPRFLTLVPCFLPSSLFSFPLPTWSTLRAWGGFRAPGAEPPSPSANRKASLRLLQNDLRAGPSLFSRKTRLSPSLLTAGNRPSSPPRCAREIPVGPPEANLGEHGVLSSPSPANLLSSWRGTRAQRPEGPTQVPAEEEPSPAPRGSTASRESWPTRGQGSVRCASSAGGGGWGGGTPGTEYKCVRFSANLS